METLPYPILIMAGGPTPEKIMDAGETEPERAFIKVGGRPMLSWVLDAVRESKACGEILCVGNAERFQSELGLTADEVLPQKDTMLENFMAGMERFRDRPKVMIATCDIPLVKASMFDNLAELISGVEADIYYPIVDVRLFDEKFPGGKRTTQKLKEGTFTGGNVFLVSPEAVLRNRDRVETVIRDRKSPAKLVRLFGLPFIIRFALKMLDIHGLEVKATQILGARMRAVITPHPEIGLDVDKPEDLVIVRDVLGHA